MSELMFFLMRHAERGIVSDDEIIFNVWEKINFLAPIAAYGK